MFGSQLVLSVDQLNAIEACLAQLGQQADIRCAMLADLSGQDIVHWDRLNSVDTPSIAALAAGDLMATLEIGRMLGGKRACNLIVQEHDEQTILVGRVGEGLLLLIATGQDVPLGWARLTIKRTSERILAIVGESTMISPPPAVDEDFEARFAAELDSMW